MAGAADDATDLTVILELTRTSAPQDPYAFRFEPQSYSLRTEGGGREVIEVDWNQALLADLEAMGRPDRDPVVIQRLGETLARILEQASWKARAREITEAHDAGRRVSITVRSNAAELYALPWELLTLPGRGQHLGSLPRVLLRYERPETRTMPVDGPRPEGGRVLLAWSAAGGGVPAADHEDALRTACVAGHPDGEGALEVLAHASVRSIADTLARAERTGRPFAVLHLLCHGGRTGSSFGLVLDGDGRPVTVAADTWRTLLARHAGTLRMVVLAACQGGNAGEPGNHLGSVAQAIHAAGLEAVIASRRPLSRAGSVVVAKELYSELLREHQSLEQALLHARAQLALDPTHLDWAALQLHARAEDGDDTRPFVFRPYRGLLAFGAEQSPFFFGREDERQEVLGDLRALVDAGRPRLLVVAGASGTGKSSLVRAGAVPDILATRGGSWEHASIRPGSQPLEALEAALATRQDEARPFLLVVDQLEELFTHTRDRAVRRDFVRRLWTLAGDDTGICCIVSLRVDFLGRCGELRLDDTGIRLDAVAYDEAHRVFVAQMSPAQLMSAITRPAERVGLRLAEGLAERIVGEVGMEPGALPLMQYTLDLLWQRRRGRELSVEAYEELGGVVGSLERRADALLDELSDDELQQARVLLTQLVGLGDDDTGDTRRRVPVEQLWPSNAAERALAQGVLRRFVDERLVVRDDRDQGGATVEIAHEALIRRWDRLREWLGDERERRIGRYIVLERTREGSREEGYLGYDPELDRRVAIRLLRVGRRGAEERARLRDQARTLARVTHPNVPAVYDVGVAKGHVVVAMEVVDGVTLRDFIGQQPRSWPEVLEVFIPLAEGLGAAHALGVVHRAFEPGVVAVDDEGVPRILGFSFDRRAEMNDAGRSASTIAARMKARHSGPRPVVSAVSGAAAEPSVLASMTESSVLGNPAYHPPELLRGMPVGPAGDQFAYCVALYEALFGDRPFAGDDIAAFAKAVGDSRKGDSRAGASTRGMTIPEDLRKILLRGLAGDPGERWPSMEALVAELRSVARPGRPQRRKAGLGALMVIAGLGAGATWWLSSGTEGVSSCPTVAERLEGVWNEERRSAAKNAIFGTARTHAVATWSWAEPALDRSAQDWAEAEHEACEAAPASPGRDERLRCLAVQRAELGAVVDALARVGPGTLEHVADAVGGLESPSVCAEPMSIVDAESSEPVAEIDELGRRLAVARVQRRVGDAPAAEGEAQAVHDRAEALELAWLRADALLERGRARRSRGEGEAGQQDLEEALLLALEHARPRTAMWAAADLAGALLEGDGATAAGLAWAKLADALASRSSADGLEHAAVQLVLGRLLERAGRSALAREQLSAAVGTRRERLGEGHPLVADAELALAELELAMGHGAAARKHAEVAVEILDDGRGGRARQAEARFALARALAGDDEARARELAEQARDALEELGEAGSERMSEVDQWLAQQHR